MSKIDFGIKPPDDFSPISDEILEKTIIWQFEQIVEKHPERGAIKTSTHNLSYRQLNNAINHMAHQIIHEMGDNKSPVAFLFSDEVFSIITFMAVVKSGRFYLGLHPSNSNEQLRTYLEDSTASLLITSTPFKETVKNIVNAQKPVKVVYFDQINTDGNSQNPEYKTGPKDNFGILYTSGSTGKPKGVVVGHLYRSQSNQYMVNQWFVSPSDRISLVTSVCYGAAYSSVFCSLLTGALLCIFDLKANTPQQTLDWIVDEELTVFRCTPSIFRTVFGLAPKGLIFSKLRFITLGGEPVSDSDIELFKGHTAVDCTLINNFASTETGSICHYPVHHYTPRFQGFLPAGFTAPGKEILLVDENGRLLEPGAKGEIVVRSRYMNPGYWRQPELTAQKFQTDPHDPDMQIYHTGDRGRWREDGVLEVLGRTDSQVKVRGFRIQLEAIDLALRNLEGVKDAATIVHQTTGKSDRLVAYFSMSGQKQFSTSQLRKELASQLPEHMIPSVFIQMDALPRTVSGKLARRELPELTNERPNLETPYTAPRNETETRITSIWQSILGLKQIGIEDSFFDLGGDSLMALNLLLSIEKEFSRKIPLAIISKASTIRQQADLLLSENELDVTPVLIPIQIKGDKNPLYCIGGKGGTPVRFQHLLKYLAEDQPVYFLRSRGFDADEQVKTTIEEIASDYLLEIKRIQQTGPYYFLGESGGGMVAYEMAQQLQRQGQETALVGMLDTYFSDRKSEKPSKPANLFMLLQKHLQTLTSGGITGVSMYLRYYFEQWKFKADEERYERRKKEILSQYGKDSILYEKVEKANLSAGRAYNPKPYSGRVVMFSAARQVRLEGNRPDHGWTEVGIGDFSICSLDCYHGNILFEPFVQQVAEKVNLCLNRTANNSF